MSRHFVTISLESSYDEAKRLILTDNIRHLPVTDERGKLIGLFLIRGFFDEILGIKTPIACATQNLIMARYVDNSIMRPVMSHSWTSREVFNPAPIYLDDKVHLLYRAMGR